METSHLSPARVEISTLEHRWRLALHLQCTKAGFDPSNSESAPAGLGSSAVVVATSAAREGESGENFGAGVSRSPNLFRAAAPTRKNPDWLC